MNPFSKDQSCRLWAIPLVCVDEYITQLMDAAFATHFFYPLMSIASESYSDDQAAVAVICDSGLMIDLQAQDKPQVPVRRAMV